MTELPYPESFPAARGGAAPRAASEPVEPLEPATDLHAVLQGGGPIEHRGAPPRTLQLARALGAALDGSGVAGGVRERIVTDGFVRREAGRAAEPSLESVLRPHAQGGAPDLVFLPAHTLEAARALCWARAAGVPVTVRGAGSSPRGGAAAREGGLTLDLAWLDAIHVDEPAGACTIGAGARLGAIHAALAARGLALKTYPENPGGTLAGWFVTSGIGLNAFACGRALDQVRAATVLLPAGEQVRFHADGRLDVFDGGACRTLTSSERGAWFASHRYAPMSLADLAGSEGTLGVVLDLTVAIDRRPALGALVIAFDHREGALAAADWVVRHAGRRLPTPANLRFFSASHMKDVRRVWADGDARGAEIDSAADALPWTSIAGPDELGLPPEPDPGPSAAYLLVDFLDLDAARTFASSLGECPGHHRLLCASGTRFARGRLRPQSSKRFGPGRASTRFTLPARALPAFLASADRLAGNAGVELDLEATWLADGTALVTAASLLDPRSGGCAVDLALGPALLDLALRHHGARPEAIGRSRVAIARRFGVEGARRVRTLKWLLDPAQVLNRGVLFGTRSGGMRERLARAAIAPAVRGMRHLFASPPLLRRVRASLDRRPGPAAGRGEPAVLGAVLRPMPAELEFTAPSSPRPAITQLPEARALECSECGACNTVCPAFESSRLRLPQMLTHLGESAYAAERIPETGRRLLDLCTRCGRCESVCPSGIPHLAMIEAIQNVADHQGPLVSERRHPTSGHSRTGPQPSAAAPV